MMDGNPQEELQWGAYNEYDSFKPVASGPETTGFKGHLDTYTSMIESADEKVEIFMYQMDDDYWVQEIEDSINQVTSQGTNVDILVDSRSFTSSGLQNLKNLSESNNRVEAKGIENAPHFSHQKNIIIDNETFYIGSANLRTTSIFNNREAGAEINNSAKAIDLSKSFHKYWNSIYSINLTKDLRREQLLKNPLFESGSIPNATNWNQETTYGTLDGSVEKTNELSFNNSFSMVQRDLTGSYNRKFTSDPFSVNGRENYNFGGYYHLNSTANQPENYTYNLKITWYNSSGDVIGEDPFFGDQFSVFDSWQLVNYTYEAPLRAEYADLTVRSKTEGGAASTDVYWDQMFVEGPEGNSLNPSITTNISEATKPSQGNLIEFNASTSISSDSKISEYNWDLGDGTELNGENITHRYQSGGNYSVILTVVSDNGLSSSRTVNLEVENIQESEPESDQNLILNSDFSNGDGFNAYNWSQATYYGSFEDAAERTNKESLSGDFSIKQVNPTSSYSRKIASQPVEIVSGEQYEYGASYYLEGTSDSAQNYTYFLEIVYLNQNKNEISSSPGEGSNFNSFDNWDEVNFTSNSPDNAKYAKIRIRTRDNGFNETNVYWDDVFLRGKTPSVTPQDYEIMNISNGNVSISKNPSKKVDKLPKGRSELMFSEGAPGKNLAAKIEIDVSSNFNASNITFGTDKDRRKSFIHNKGSSSTIKKKTLMVPRVTGSGAVRVCPGAESLNQVNSSCKNGYTVESGETVNGVTNTEVTVEGENYYELEGITGTGGQEIFNWDTEPAEAEVEESFTYDEYESSANGKVDLYGGNITKADLRGKQSTDSWAGIFGKATGNLTLGNQDSRLYAWEADPSAIFASNSSVNWTNIAAGTTGEVDNYYSLDGSDTADNTFNMSVSVETGGNVISGVPAVKTYNQSGKPYWITGILTDDTPVFYADPSRGKSFNNISSNYQMIVPADDNSLTSYNMYIEFK
jgi:hypothetical protein